MHPFRRERILQQLSQHHCARAVGVSQAKLSLIELGHRLPTAAEARELAALVDGDPAKLFPKVRDVGGIAEQKA